MSEPSASDLRALSKMRFEDARILLDAERHSAAYYLAGYAVECALKARIATQFRSAVIPNRKFVNDIHTHDLQKLLGLANLTALHADRVRQSPEFSANWSLVVEWNEGSRYELVDAFLSHGIVSAVGHRDNGILPWLTLHW